MQKKNNFGMPLKQSYVIFSFFYFLKTIQPWSVIPADLEGDYLYRWEGQHRVGESGGGG